MARYAILKGVGTRIRPTFVDSFNNENWPEMWRKWPHLVAQGPSGQLAILPPMSGAGSLFLNTGTPGTEGGAAFKQIAYEDIVNHVSLAWKHNSCLHWWRFSLQTIRTDLGLRWHPYQWGETHLNVGGPAFDLGNDFDDFVIEDGAHHTLHIFSQQSVHNGCAGIAHQDGIMWATPGGEQPSYQFGNWTGQLPFEVSAGHKFTGMRMWGNPGDFENGHFNFPAQQAGGNLDEGIQASVFYRSGTSDPDTETHNICDMIDFDGAIFYCTQTTVMAKRFDTKGSFIYMDFFDNQQDGAAGGEANFGVTDVDVARGTQGLHGGPVTRKFTKHHVNGQAKLFMLQGDGKIFEVEHAGIRKIADLTQLISSPFGSGIVGGSMQKTPLSAVGQFPAPQAFRPYMTSFNNQLHAFLNYSSSSSIFQQRTGTPVGKTSDGSNAQGVCWFTSFDGVNWSDRTNALANASQSGIITPSGNFVQKTTWGITTAPYVYSAFQNANFPSGYGSRSGYPDANSKFGTEASQITGNTAPENRGTDAINNLKPSGFRQATGEPKETGSRHQNDVDSGKAHMGGDTDRLPIWTSGNLIDLPDTPFDQLQIKLDKGTISGYLYPTIVDYPSGYDFVDPSDLDGVIKPTNLLPEASGGFWGPFGQGTRGWDFTGVRNRHITGYIDETDEETNSHELFLCFSDNPPSDITVDSDQVASHFYALNKASGWRQVNYVHWGGAFCGGYQAVDLHDPEIIIPSGSIDDPNPFVDARNGRTRIRFKVLDFGFWDTVQCKLNYSIDEGLNWKDCTISGSLLVGTGTKETDPSGIGIDREFSEIFWLHEQDLNRNVFEMPRIRMRAEVK